MSVLPLPRETARATAGTYQSCLALIRPANAGSCPSRQRDCVASASRSAETKGTAQLVLRTQAGRKEQRCCAASASHSGKTQGERPSLPRSTTLAPTDVDGLFVRLMPIGSARKAPSLQGDVCI